jgi:hypothetical protein
MTRPFTPPAALMFALIIGLPASAQAPQDLPPVPPVQMVPPSAAASAAAVFTTAEAHAIRDYYVEHPDEVGPTQAPGVAESLTRGATLPARLEARPVPDELKEKLAERPGHEILIAGSVALLVKRESRVIRDLLRDALPARN